MNTLETLQDKINHNKNLDFGDVLSQAIELYKKVWLQGFFLVLLLFVVLTPFMLAVFLPTYHSALAEVNNGTFNSNSGIGALQAQTDNFRFMVIAATFVVSFFTTGLVAAFYRIVKSIDHNKGYKFLDFFYFFKLRYMGKMFAIASFSLLIALLNFALEKFLPPTSASLFSGFISIATSVYTTLFVVFFAFNAHLESSDFFTLSFNLGTKKWLFLFGVMLISLIMAFVGMIACFVGMLFTMCIVYLPTYVVYKTIFGFDTLSDIDRIGDI